MGADTLAWWTALRSIAALNVLMWICAAWALWNWRDRWPPDAWMSRRWQLMLSAGYVLGCGYRSLLPVFDVQRLVLVDSFWSSVLVGRSVATVAEMCFAAQWALLLREAARDTGSTAGALVSRGVLPLIAIAEMFSWYSVLTTSNLGHVVEESLWGLCAAALVGSLLQMWHRVHVTRRPFLLLWCVAGSAYVAYMGLVDVPMYWSRWVSDEALGRAYLPLVQGLADVAQRWVVSHDWADWRTEVVWMSAYFSVAVWISVALALAPRMQSPQASAPTRQRSL